MRRNRKSTDLGLPEHVVPFRFILVRKDLIRQQKQYLTDSVYFFKHILSRLRYLFVGDALALIFTLINSMADSNISTDLIESQDISSPKTEKMIDVGGCSLHCCVYGKGFPTVVLVNGFGAPQAYWNPVVPDLAAQTTVLTYDRPTEESF